MDRRDRPDESDEREERREDLERLERDIGENYESGFGKLLEDSPPAEIDQAMRES